MTIRSTMFRFTLLTTFVLTFGPLACKPADPSAPAAKADPAPSPAPTSAPAPVVSTRAKELYAQHCALCHGAEGRGDGKMAQMLNPPPRGLTSDPWRYLDTSSPERLRESMIALLRDGMPDKAMPGLAGKASEAEIEEVADFVLSLRQ